MYDIPYIEACVILCEEYDFDMESIMSLIDKQLVEKIKNEAIQLNLLKEEKRFNTLPV